MRKVGSLSYLDNVHKINDPGGIIKKTNQIFMSAKHSCIICASLFNCVKEYLTDYFSQSSDAMLKKDRSRKNTSINNILTDKLCGRV